MPEYEFIHDETGEEHVEFFKEPIRIGKCIPGTKLRRVPSLPVKPVSRSKEFVAWSRRPVPKSLRKEVPFETNAQGFPVMTGSKSVQEYCDHNNATVDKVGSGEYIDYD